MPQPSRKSRTGELSRLYRAKVPSGILAAARFAASGRSRVKRWCRSFAGELRLHPCRGSDGFTLLEVLVALTILGMSLTVLLAIFSQALAREHARDRAVAARIFAQSLIAQTLTAQTLGLGVSSGHSDAGLSWQLHVDPYGEASGEPATGLQVARVSATVTWSGAGNRQSLTLATLRLLPKEQSK